MNSYHIRIKKEIEDILLKHIEKTGLNKADIINKALAKYLKLDIEIKGDSILELKKEQLRISNNHAQLKLDVDRKIYVDVQESTHAYSLIFFNLKRDLLDLPRKLSMNLANKQAREIELILLNEIEDSFFEFSKSQLINEESKSKPKKELVKKIITKNLNSKFISSQIKRLNVVFKNPVIKNKEVTLKYFCCTKKFLIEYVSKQFNSKMNLENYGTYWRIKYIKPLKPTKPINKEEVIKRIHYTNLKPIKII